MKCIACVCLAFVDDLQKLTYNRAIIRRGYKSVHKVMCIPKQEHHFFREKEIQVKCILGGLLTVFDRACTLHRAVLECGRLWEALKVYS